MAYGVSLFINLSNLRLNNSLSLVFLYIVGYIAATTTMATALLDPRGKTGFENFDADFEDDIQSKIELYANIRYRYHMKEVLPWLYNRGAFKI